MIPRNMWVRVRVSGTVDLAANPEFLDLYCTPSGNPKECPPRHDGASIGPLGFEDGLEVWVALINARYVWSPRAVGTDAAEDLMYAQAGQVVQVTRGTLNDICDTYQCSHRKRLAGAYLMSGSQVLTVEEVDPLSVRADRTETERDREVGFTAASDEEVENLQWSFVPGDTLLEAGVSRSAAPAGGASWSISAAASAPAADWSVLAAKCGGKEVCAIPVPESGRMWVRGRLDDQPVFAKSQIVRVQPVRLKLECTPNPVTRGKEISCTASKAPASASGELRITGWSFEGKARTDGDVTSTEWKGIMVKGGTVEVRGTIDGKNVKPAEQSIRVERRQWPVMQLTDHPTVFNQLDLESMAAYPPNGKAFGRFKLLWPYFHALGITRATSGPNTGLAVISDPVQLRGSEVYIHPALTPTPTSMHPGSPGRQLWHDWHDDQNRKGSGTCDGAGVA
ncbi:MAG: hypothetical protein M3P24_10470, partial [Gemmatimonadota bacterium]|nr:hypothetical protein [Gemmatimonadota bacterium]